VRLTNEIKQRIRETFSGEEGVLSDIDVQEIADTLLGFALALQDDTKMSDEYEAVNQYK
jgi:hypothetical protein